MITIDVGKNLFSKSKQQIKEVPLFGFLAVVFVLFPLVGAAVGMQGDIRPSLIVSAIGIGFSAYTIFAAYINRKLRTMVPEDALAATLDADYETIRRVKEEKGLKPALRVNGTSYYARSDFGDLTSLLRPSVRPSEAMEELVRPAHTVSTPVSHLLHASANPRVEVEQSQPETPTYAHEPSSESLEEQPLGVQS